MKTFLKPLSREEESQCVWALQDPEAGKRSQAKQLLIERNLRLVAHIARKYLSPEDELDDLISIGCIGLIKAVDTFDPQKNNRLSSYAARCIDNELLMMMRGKKKTSREVSLYEPIGTDGDGNEISLLDILVQEQEDIVEKMEQRRLAGGVRELVCRILDPREQEVILLRYGLSEAREMTQKEVGERLGISRSYVSRIEKKALLKLLDAYRRRGEETAS